MERSIRAEELLSKTQVLRDSIPYYIYIFQPLIYFPSFYSRHFIVLIASTPIKEQYTDWVRLVESRIRHLILGLEKNQHISLVHVSPQGYEQVKKEQR